MILGVILAGGASRRMGADKALLTLAARPMIGHVLARIGPQVGAVAINTNGDPARFGAFGLPVLPDPVPGQPGPIAGVLAGLAWAARTRPGAALLTVPADCPFLPPDLVARLAPAGHAASGGRHHPVIALWPAESAPALWAAYQAGTRRMEAFAAIAASRRVVWEGEDPFTNINTPADRAAAELRITSYP
jgi:molybdopterin-guanine dinucleotide biosynthesis protein A